MIVTVSSSEPTYEGQSDPKEELQRALPLLPSEALGCLEKLSEGQQKQIQLMISVAKALEKKKIYEKTHYVFTHATTVASTALFCVIKELMKDRMAFKPFGPFKCFRKLAPEPMSCAEFLKKHPLLLQGKETDHEYGDELLSVDGYIWSDDDAESALSFLVGNYSVKRDTVRLPIDEANAWFDLIPDDILTSTLDSFAVPQALKKTINQILLDYQMDMLRASKVKLTAQITHQMAQHYIGDLYLICIPKSTVRDSNRSPVYAAKCNGIPVGDVSNTDALCCELDELQTASFSRDRQGIPQYRILGRHLDPQDVRSFCIAPAPKPLYKRMKQQIRNCLLPSPNSNFLNNHKP